MRTSNGEGISAEVIDARKPLDVDTTVASVRRSNHPVMAHQGWKCCGWH